MCVGVKSKRACCRRSKAVHQLFRLFEQRSRVNFFMNKFRKLGFIDYNGSLKVHNSLLTVVLRD